MIVVRPWCIFPDCVEEVHFCRTSGTPPAYVIPNIMVLESAWKTILFGYKIMCLVCS